MDQNRMQMNAVNLRGYKPLVYTDAGLLFYKRSQLYRYADSVFSPVISLGTPSWKDSCRILVRLFRTEPKTAVFLPTKKLLISWHKRLDYVDPNTGSCKTVFFAREGFSDLLNICPSEDGKYTAYWGDYGANRRRQEVHIYAMTQDGFVEILHTFPAGSVRHIHNIIPKQSGGFYIFTGDTEPTAGIYAADPEFTHVEAVALGSQQFRSVAAFDTDTGLLYATDAVNEPNGIYLLDHNGNLKKIAEINGSCIYGTKTAESYLFSTTVEPDEENRGIFSWFSCRRGKGILSNEVHLLQVNSKMQVRCLAVFRKDRLPMKLFQYGSVQFPRGSTEDLWIYPVAVRKLDAKAIQLKNGEGL